MEQELNRSEQPIYVTCYETEFKYNGFWRSCTLEISSTSEKNWTLALPDGIVMIGVGSVLRQEGFMQKLQYLGSDVLDWIEQKFIELLPDDEKRPGIAVVENDVKGRIALVPADEEGVWVLYTPNGNIYTVGANNPYTFFEAEKIKQFEEQFANKCVEFLREEFAELYKDKQ